MNISALFSLYMPFFLFVLGMILAALLAWFGIEVRKRDKFNKSFYRAATVQKYSEVANDLGKYGEYLTSEVLSRYRKEGAKLLFNVYIPTENGKTSEIDILMIGSDGIVVFESKNYSGWIFGDEHAHYWTQSLKAGRGSVKENFYNPILQNETHIKNLRALLPESLRDRIPLYSVVVFSNRCELKRVTVTDPDTPVIRRSALNETLQKLFSRNKQKAEPHEIDKLYSLLLPFAKVDEEVKNKHVANIKSSVCVKKVKNTPEDFENASVAAQESVKTKICPRCGMPLVMRVSRRGERRGEIFFGCSAYPYCRYTETNSVGSNDVSST